MPSPLIIGGIFLFCVCVAMAIWAAVTYGGGSPAPSGRSPAPAPGPSGSPSSGSPSSTTTPPPPPSGTTGSVPTAPLTPPPPPPPSALSGYTGPVSGFDYPYNDLGNWPTSDPNQCASYCASNPNCKLFVTATDSQNCWTKSAAQYKTPSTTRNVYPKVGTTLP